MSKTTTNYGLVKPELTDPADITAMNPNWDKIDAELANIINRQKPWDVDNNVGKINANSATLTHTLNLETSTTEELSLIPMINSGKIKLSFYIDNKATSAYGKLEKISILNNGKVVTSYTTGMSGTKNISLSVSKGDVISLSITGRTTLFGSNSGSVTIKNIYILANLETPYKFIDIVE